mmetsp:Transcript_7680/g.30396  ORF Transcript_7680/g.30396 Transcript_7680/m.30396 type:complete len:467 (-) Transcript_7680:454-1854(-)
MPFLPRIDTARACLWDASRAMRAPVPSASDSSAPPSSDRGEPATAEPQATMVPTPAGESSTQVPQPPWAWSAATASAAAASNAASASASRCAAAARNRARTPGAGSAPPVPAAVAARRLPSAPPLASPSASLPSSAARACSLAVPAQRLTSPDHSRVSSRCALLSSMRAADSIADAACSRAAASPRTSTDGQARATAALSPTDVTASPHERAAHCPRPSAMTLPGGGRAPISRSTDPAALAVASTSITSTSPRRRTTATTTTAGRPSSSAAPSPMWATPQSASLPPSSEGTSSSSTSSTGSTTPPSAVSASAACSLSRAAPERNVRAIDLASSPVRRAGALGPSCASVARNDVDDAEPSSAGPRAPTEDASAATRAGASPYCLMSSEDVTRRRGDAFARADARLLPPGASCLRADTMLPRSGDGPSSPPAARRVTWKCSRAGGALAKSAISDGRRSTHGCVASLAW